MNSLNFENTFNNKTDNVGDRFQTFVYELLKKSDYPKLYKFQTAGKDGGIDLIQQLNNKRTVVECKYIADNDIKAAKKRWNEVNKHLKTHLVASIPKEKQYKPWLDSSKPITSYLFCVSSEIGNQNGFDEFEKEITNCFKNLANSHRHLKHLENIRVEIINRSKLLQKLDNFPQLKFRWFSLAEKFGLIPIQNKQATTSFRTFLEEESLPFYSRSKHLEKEPNAEIQNEEQLIGMLENTSLHGLIITGNGGAGKTRLTLELGRLAYKKGWLVFRCNESVNASDLNRFAETIASDTKILLLIDYVETQKDFNGITVKLKTLNDSHGFQIKYIANCRSNYYPTIRSTPNHNQVLLSSSSSYNKSIALWLEKYQASVVQHILDYGNIRIDEKYLKVYKNNPILAVFLLYLRQKNQGQKFENLLQEDDFGKWIQKRTAMSFNNVTDFELKLAKLVAMLPFSEDVSSEFDEFNSKLLGILANDRWIEKFQNNEWRSIHDVFVDQIILSYIRDNSHFIEKFVRDVFSFAYSTDCLKSAFVSVQRLAKHLEDFEVDFHKLLNDEIDKELLNWKKIRNYLLKTSLLNENQKFELLSKRELWEDAAKNYAFQTGLGVIIRKTIQNSVSLTETQHSNAKYWLIKIANTSFNDFFLTWAIRFLTKEISGLMLDRIKQKSSSLKTSFLFIIWLNSDLPKSEIREYFVVWLRKFKGYYNSIFICKSWLDAKGDVEVVRAFIRNWLKRHHKSIEARFVYCSWLDAGGDTDFVKESIRQWLALHQKSSNADLVYSSWLKANGNISLIKKPIRLWLSMYHTTHTAQFIYKSWLDATGEFDFIREFIRLWLVKYRTDIKASFVYESWLKAKGERGFVKEHLSDWLHSHQTIPAARFVYESWLKAKGEPEFIEEYLKNWLEFENNQSNLYTQIIYESWIYANGESDVIKKYLTEWLAEHQTTQAAQFVYKSWLKAKSDPQFIEHNLKKWLNFENNQTALDTQFIYKSWLDANGDIEFVKEHIKKWLDENQKAFEADYVIRAWLNANGEIDFVKEPLRKWLAEHHDTLKADFVMRTWLDAKGDTEFIKEHLKVWLDKHNTNIGASYVYKSWLDAKGETEFIKEYLKVWLEEHQTYQKADYVIRAWLKANGEIEFVEEPLKEWLKKYKKKLDVSFVCSAWLDANGDFDFIKEFAFDYLAKHYDKNEASHLAKRLAKLTDLPIETIRHILLWCAKFNDDEDAVYTLASFKDKLFDCRISNEFLVTSESVIELLLLKNGLDVETTEQISAVFFNLFLNAGLDNADSFKRIENVFMKWLKYSDSLGANQTTSDDQKLVKLERFASLLEKILSNPNTDNFTIQRFLRHFNHWLPGNRQELQPIMHDLQTKYPSDVWEIVTYS